MSTRASNLTAARWLVVALLIGSAACAADRAGRSSSAGRGGSAASAGRKAGGSGGVSGGHAGAAEPEAGAPAADGGSTDAPDASADGGGTHGCTEIGWCELPDTKLESVCPDAQRYPAIQGYEGCGGVINDWSGGMGDTKRNRLLLWGGGHHGYFGNELYALELERGAIVRLNEPSDVSGVDFDECTPPEVYADGRPSSRHTYDGMVYLPDRDQMYTFAGSSVPCGYAVHSTWLLDLTAIEAAPSGKPAPWIDKDPQPYPTKAGYGLVADYDPNSKTVVLNDGYNLWAYDAGSNAYSLLNDSNATNAHIDYHMTGRVDPKRRLFIVVGGSSSPDGGMQVFDLSEGSDHAQQNWTKLATGCEPLLAAMSPGFAYDEKQDRFVGWAGGNDVYTFDADTKTCSKQTLSGGPGAQNENGTFGRFRYFRDLGVFAVVNGPGRNAWLLRLRR
jgi:hypothetical protein